MMDTDTERKVRNGSNVNPFCPQSEEAPLLLGAGSSSNLRQSSPPKGAKYTSLVLLTLTNVVDAVATRYSRLGPKDGLYITSTAIVMVETMKFFGSIALLAIEEGTTRSRRLTFKSIFPTLDVARTAKVSVIAFLYVIQNNLTLIAASHLDVPTFQATYQLRLLTTALFSVTVLKREISVKRWLSLGLLVVGVVIVKLATLLPAASLIGDDAQHAMSKNEKAIVHQTANEGQSHTIGFAAITAASVLSGISGVYMEKILKSSTSSVWIWNAELSLISIPLSAAHSLAADWNAVYTKGFFHGYDNLVWFVLVNKAATGLIIAAVIKYADNILKGFSTTVAIVFGTFANEVIFHVHLNAWFASGAAIVGTSVILYAYGA